MNDQDKCQMYLINGSIYIWAKGKEVAIQHFQEECKDGYFEIIENPSVELLPDDKAVYLFTDKYGEDRWWFEIYPEEGDKLKEKTTVQKFFSRFLENCDPIIAYGDE
jgi:acylphosphatase